MKKQLTISDLEKIIDSSFNYDRIRIYAVDFFNRTNAINGISEKCNIVFNPFRAKLFEFPDEIGIEKYFDYELVDNDFSNEKAKEFKKCFTTALQILYNQSELAFQNDY